MTLEEIIQTFRIYCETGQLDGKMIEATWCGNRFRMINVRIGDDDDLYFDQYRFYGGGNWEICQTCARIRNQVHTYLEDCIKYAQKFISIDKNLF